MILVNRLLLLNIKKYEWSEKCLNHLNLHPHISQIFLKASTYEHLRMNYSQSSSTI